MARGSQARKVRTTVTTRRSDTRKPGGAGRRKYTEGLGMCSVENKGTQEQKVFATNQAKFVHKVENPDQPMSEHSKPGNTKQAVCKQWFDQVQTMGLQKIRREFVNKVKKYNNDSSKDACQHAENTNKNRYDDVMLLDKTRVKVSINPDKDDYIHASMVAVYSELTYICAQGPMENTVHQFWLMCIQEEVKVILQLCMNVEDGKEKCSEYFPDGKDKTATYGPVELKVVDVQKTVAGAKKVTKTKIHAKFKDKSLTCTHLLYYGWPDHGVPESVATCIEVRKIVHKLYDKKPVVIHCSAGIGRTGTFVAIEMVCHKLLKEENYDFSMVDLIKTLRDQRMHAVQNDQQYSFIYRCVLEILVSEDGLSRNPRVIQFVSEFEEMVERKKKARAAKDEKD